MDEWIKKMCIYTMEFFSDIKNEIMLFVGKWMKVEIIMISEVSQSLRDKYCMFSLIYGSWVGGGPIS
jgi:hypothetical protein